MMNKYAALQAFWGSFGWKAYNELTVPDDALTANNGKYITYESATSSFDDTLILSASLWHKSTSWVTIHAKAEEIARKIELSAPAIKIDDGWLAIRKGSPFAQDSADDDDTIRRVRLVITAEYLTRY